MRPAAICVIKIFTEKGFSQEIKLGEILFAVVVCENEIAVFEREDGVSFGGLIIDLEDPFDTVSSTGEKKWEEETEENRETEKGRRA